ncbi:MAG: helix-turn-helix domain-containing protein [Propionibacteriales bacterium]|nr:helix-turn-helix domain-containing protein [Propionibacteriales bacterium]
MAEENTTPDPQALRALAHPVRLRMLGSLRIDGPSTASRLAEQLGLNTGATSYHLRQLAQHGFIEEDADRGNQRDRWWRATHRFTHVDEAPAEPAARDAADAFAQAAVIVQSQALQRAVEERPSLPDEWRRVSTSNDVVLRLTPEQAEQLTRRVVDLMMETYQRTPEPAEPVPGTRTVMFQFHTFPYPGPTPSADEPDSGSER